MILRAVKTVGIVGYPGAGKTTLSESLGGAISLPVIHTDDYLNLPHETQPRAILDDLRGLWETGYIVEGTSVVRLFQRGWQPDLLIFIRGGDMGPACRSIRKMIDNKMNYCLAPVEFV